MKYDFALVQKCKEDLEEEKQNRNMLKFCYDKKLEVLTLKRRCCKQKAVLFTRKWGIWGINMSLKRVKEGRK